jgi:excisionase family DNA binding protein
LEAQAGAEGDNMVQSGYVSTARVAEALGVSVTTVKRWVDEGILPAHRTPGGHRRLLLADVLRIVRESHFPHLDLSRLGLGCALGPAASPEALADQLAEALERGESGATRSLVHGAYGGGLAVEVLADRVVAPALARIGQDWERGRIDVFQEHQATRLCAAALDELKPRLEEHARNDRPLALGGGPEGDPYLLANLLAEMVLLDAGWQVMNLGPNTPLVSFRKAVQMLRPRLVWLSVSYLEGPETFTRQYREFFREATQLGTAVALGGQALTQELRSGLPYTTFGDGLSHLAAFARTLHPLGRRPRRGRPVGS